MSAEVISLIDRAIARKRARVEEINRLAPHYEGSSARAEEWIGMAEKAARELRELELRGARA